MLITLKKERHGNALNHCPQGNKRLLLTLFLIELLFLVPFLSSSSYWYFTQPLKRLKLCYRLFKSLGLFLPREVLRTNHKPARQLTIYSCTHVGYEYESKLLYYLQLHKRTPLIKRDFPYYLFMM